MFIPFFASLVMGKGLDVKDIRSNFAEEMTEQLSKTRRNYEHICEISFIQQGREKTIEGSAN